VSASNLAPALDMMRDRPYLVSGLAPGRDKAALHRELTTALRRSLPALLDATEASQRARKRRLEEDERERQTPFTFSFF
jgi:hypothetical protein